MTQQAPAHKHEWGRREVSLDCRRERPCVGVAREGQTGVDVVWHKGLGRHGTGNARRATGSGRRAGREEEAEVESEHDQDSAA